MSTHKHSEAGNELRSLSMRRCCGGARWCVWRVLPYWDRAPSGKPGRAETGRTRSPGSLPCVSAPALTRRAQAAHGGVQRGRPVCRAWWCGPNWDGGMRGACLVGSRHQGARRRVVLGREGGRAGNCQPAGAGEPGRPVAGPRRMVPVGRRGPTPEGPPRFSCPLIVLSMNTDRGEKRAFCVERRQVRVRPDRSVMARRAGRAVRRGTEAGKHHSQVRPLVRALRALLACAMRRA